MFTKLPLFPLKLVVFPNEDLNLHVFEPRYKQLIKDCIEKDSTFGIPAYLNDKVQAWGTELKLSRIINTYEDGRMDISTRGVNVFRIEKFYNPMEGKLYSGGEIEYKQYQKANSYSQNFRFSELLNEFSSLIKASIEFDSADPLLSFTVGHKLGLSLRQEYELLKTKTEEDRVAILIDHLESNIPVVRAMETARERIKKNGHFKNFDPINF